MKNTNYPFSAQLAAAVITAFAVLGCDEGKVPAEARQDPPASDEPAHEPESANGAGRPEEPGEVGETSPDLPPPAKIPLPLTEEDRFAAIMALHRKITDDMVALTNQIKSDLGVKKGTNLTYKTGRGIAQWIHTYPSAKDGPITKETPTMKMSGYYGEPPTEAEEKKGYHLAAKARWRIEAPDTDPVESESRYLYGSDGRWVVAE